MAIYNIKGRGLIHKRITPICRQRPIDEIKRETIDEIWQKYKDASQDPDLEDADFHIVLTVDKK